jgi:DNA-binding response OmpR family regulator
MDQEKALGMGISAFVMKPFVLSEVGRTIRNVLDAARN